MRGRELRVATERLPSLRVQQERFHAGTEGGGVAKWHKQPGSTLLDHFWDAADVHGDAGAAKAHRLEDTQAEAFALGSKHAQVRNLQVIFNLVPTQAA